MPFAITISNSNILLLTKFQHIIITWLAIDQACELDYVHLIILNSIFMDSYGVYGPIH